MPLIICASPHYIERHGRPDWPEALSTHDCLINDYQSDATSWRFRSETEDVHVRVHGTFRSNSPGATAEMAKSGLGIARSPQYAVETALQNGQLERLLEDFKSGDFGLYALYPTNRHLTARVRALIDHLAQSLKAG